MGSRPTKSIGVTSLATRPRLSPRSLPSACRPAMPLTLINVSASGILVEGKTRLVPGHEITIEFEGSISPKQIKVKRRALSGVGHRKRVAAVPNGTCVRAAFGTGCRSVGAAGFDPRPRRRTCRRARRAMSRRLARRPRNAASSIDGEPLTRADHRRPPQSPVLIHPLLSTDRPPPSPPRTLLRIRDPAPGRP